MLEILSSLVTCDETPSARLCSKMTKESVQQDKKICVIICICSVSNRGSLHLFGSKTELGCSLVEDDELGFEEDVSVDGESNSGVALYTTETR